MVDDVLRDARGRSHDGVGGRVDPLAVAHQRAAQRLEDPLLLLGELGRDAELAGRERDAEAAGPRVAERDRGLADPHEVAVHEPATAVDAQAVHVGAVLREAVVAQRPLARLELELGVQPRHLRVPRERDVRLQPPADRDRRGALVERDDLLRALIVAQEQERLAALLGIASRPQVVRRGQVQREGRLHHRLEKMLRSDRKMLMIDTKMPVASQMASASVPRLRSTLKSTTISAADSR